jgi:hypothetical protein
MVFDMMVYNSEVDFDNCTAQFFRIIVRINEFVVGVKRRNGIYDVSV